MAGKSKTYTNGEVTIKWTPDSCIHSGICVAGLPDVFKPKERPWINMEAAGTEALIEQVKNCPSGALSYFMNDEQDQTEQKTIKTLVEVRPNGPLLVYGTLEVKNQSGEVEIKSKTTAFCRCGASANKPYCDGQHVKIDFQDG
jgi:uncharacterized Fe-S cluster protein YjdI